MTKNTKHICADATYKLIQRLYNDLYVLWKAWKDLYVLDFICMGATFRINKIEIVIHAQARKA